MPQTASLKPRPKVAAAGAGGVGATLLVTLANALGLDLPTEAAAAIVALIAFLAGYFKTEARP